MSTVRTYLATSTGALRRLYETGSLPTGSYESVLPESDDELDEFEAMRAAARIAHDRHGEVVVVAADLGDDAGDVPFDAIASFHVGDDLAWYATQELGDLLY